MVQQQAAAVAYKDAVSVLAVLVAFLIPLTFHHEAPAGTQRRAAHALIAFAFLLRSFDQ